ncbi:hypothetical protein IEQ34_000258 [Dendrobium chrysotoxum]|uniref:Uncharacterized protein n=1 Tax=Dendrobium chrysotoxum TaxID=161865 RepID=A0AAV7H8K3_DENCH|nr:hypothetical protein IEQ34_000258 [Dendrobium chrysotoxum]
MGKKNGSPAAHRRPWRLLRLALFWARKGAAFKQRIFLNFKNLRRADRLHYWEREFSFDDTPAFHFKINLPASLRLPRIPCITPSISFDDDEEIIFERCKAMKLLEAGFCMEDQHNDEIDLETSSSISDTGAVEKAEGQEEQEIDSRAENFIMEFYEQIKLQRQISYLEYNEMLDRGLSS